MEEEEGVTRGLGKEGIAVAAKSSTRFVIFCRLHPTDDRFRHILSILREDPSSSPFEKTRLRLRTVSHTRDVPH